MWLETRNVRSCYWRSVMHQPLHSQPRDPVLYSFDHNRELAINHDSPITTLSLFVMVLNLTTIATEHTSLNTIIIVTIIMFVLITPSLLRHHYHYCWRARARKQWYSRIDLDLRDVGADFSASLAPGRTPQNLSPCCSMGCPRILSDHVRFLSTIKVCKFPFWYTY